MTSPEQPGRPGPPPGGPARRPDPRPRQRSGLVVAVIVAAVALVALVGVVLGTGNGQEVVLDPTDPEETADDAGAGDEADQDADAGDADGATADDEDADPSDADGTGEDGTDDDGTDDDGDSDAEGSDADGSEDADAEDADADGDGDAEDVDGSEDVPTTAIIVGGGSRIAMLDADDLSQVWSVDPGLGEVTGISVHPESTTRVAYVAVVVDDGDGPALANLTVRDGSARMEAERRSGHTIGDALGVVRPVWSETGDALAWLEPAPEGGATLRLIPAAGVAGQPQEVHLPDVAPTGRAELWGTFEGRSLLYVTQLDGPALEVPLGGAAGAWDVGEPVEAQIGDASAVLALASEPEPGVLPSWIATAAEGQVALLDTVGHQGLAPPAGLVPDTGRLWMAGTTDRIVIGQGGRAWVTGRGEDPAALDGPVRSADWVGP